MPTASLFPSSVRWWCWSEMVSSSTLTALNSEWDALHGYFHASLSRLATYRNEGAFQAPTEEVDSPRMPVSHVSKDGLCRKLPKAAYCGIRHSSGSWFRVSLNSCFHQILQIWKRSYMRFAAHSVAWTSPVPLRTWYLLCLLHSSFSAKRNSTSQYSEPTTYRVRFFRYDIVISDASTASWPSQIMLPGCPWRSTFAHYSGRIYGRLGDAPEENSWCMSFPQWYLFATVVSLPLVR